MNVSQQEVRLLWVERAKGVPYFQTEDGLPWHPIGQNDAITWSELNPLFLRKDVKAVETYFKTLVGHGVTCMRLMLEYAQGRHRYFENAPGKWSPNMVQFWDDLFAMCERYGIRILLTPFDTFWMWIKFKHHPYCAEKGGPLKHPSRALLSRATRESIKARLTFAAERWGGSGALFAWDLWNEIHPAHAEMSAVPFADFIHELSGHLRAVETRCFGRSHLQTVSLFGPELTLRREMAMEEAIFRHPALDFATIHIYEHGTIDDPKNTVDPAAGMGKIVQRSLAEIKDGRPFLDTEHGPIHCFKDRHVTLPEQFDDEYFRHLQWAHLASGGAGGGMRWPNRHPHSLTMGMRIAQRGMARFLPLIDWLKFPRVNVSDDLIIRSTKGKLLASKRMARFACATSSQALVYIISRDGPSAAGTIDRSFTPRNLVINLPMLGSGTYSIFSWDTVRGEALCRTTQTIEGGGELLLPAFAGDIALAIRKL